ncbi:alpha/beta hydrolase [Kribbella sp. NPDC026611]|uniref:alpha/beta fold hydrolase n=1 Tax=Kribbella sp. NPDC026611 TaxID=3154911 RepID=UPI0033E6C2D9
MRHRLGALLAAIVLLLVPSAASAAIATSPSGFRDGYADNLGTRVHYVVGGHGPALVLLHGWPETWRTWAKVAPNLTRDHTVVMIDLRGLGDSQPARTDAGNYTALAVASDVRSVVLRLHLGTIDIAGHDWGAQVALAYAVAHRNDVRRLALLEAPPTSDYLNLVQQNPRAFWWDWFINGPRGDLAEQLVAGREREFYLPFYETANGAISRREENEYIAAYSRPSSTHAGFEFFRQQDEGLHAVDQLIAKDGKLTIPVLGVGGENSSGGLVGQDLPRVATNVTTAIVPGTDHWLIEENPTYVTDLFTRFFHS